MTFLPLNLGRAHACPSLCLYVRAVHVCIPVQLSSTLVLLPAGSPFAKLWGASGFLPLHTTTGWRRHRAALVHDHRRGAVAPWSWLVRTSRTLARSRSPRRLRFGNHWERRWSRLWCRLACRWPGRGSWTPLRSPAGEPRAGPRSRADRPSCAAEAHRRQCPPSSWSRCSAARSNNFVLSLFGGRCTARSPSTPPLSRETPFVLRKPTCKDLQPSHRLSLAGTPRNQCSSAASLAFSTSCLRRWQ